MSIGLWVSHEFFGKGVIVSICETSETAMVAFEKDLNYQFHEHYYRSSRTKRKASCVEVDLNELSIVGKVKYMVLEPKRRKV